MAVVGAILSRPSPEVLPVGEADPAILAGLGLWALDGHDVRIVLTVTAGSALSLSLRVAFLRGPLGRS